MGFAGVCTALLDELSSGLEGHTRFDRLSALECLKRPKRSCLGCLSCCMGCDGMADGVSYDGCDGQVRYGAVTV